jgi:hypothetical protein
MIKKIDFDPTLYGKINVWGIIFEEYRKSTNLLRHIAKVYKSDKLFTMNIIIID